MTISSSTWRKRLCGCVLGLFIEQLQTATGDGFVTAPGRGFLVVYIDNQSIGKDVWFDNFSIGNFESMVMEEDHYYPFGLTVNTFSSAVGKNPFKYNTKELESHFGLEMYDYGNRSLDPQLGRFTTIDKYAEKYYSMTNYQYGGNNPVLYIDVNGDSIAIRSENSSAIYHEGNLYNKDGSKYNGAGTTTDKNGNISLKNGFLKDVFNALNKIRDGGDEGKKLVDGLTNRSEWTTIKESQNGQNETKGQLVTYNPNQVDGGPDENGNTTRPAFIGLAHELGHEQDGLDGNLDNNLWFRGTSPRRDYPNSEKYGSHVENKIRAENGFPLRKFYTQSRYGTGEGRLLIEGTRTSANYDYTYPKKQD